MVTTINSKMSTEEKQVKIINTWGSFNYIASGASYGGNSIKVNCITFMSPTPWTLNLFTTLLVNKSSLISEIFSEGWCIWGTLFVYKCYLSTLRWHFNWVTYFGIILYYKINGTFQYLQTKSHQIILLWRFSAFISISKWDR